jgi:BirA family biotin operon repressor/biotin-[acetyl-CoA-carboxylase] ligase
MKQTSIDSNSLFVGKVALHLNEVDSTNTFALDLLSKSNPIEGTVIYADIQSAGRGQFGSKWQAEAGQNLTLSIIFAPKRLTTTNHFGLSIAVALGIYDCLQTFLSRPIHIKWPNDIYCGTHKIGGILIENILKGVHLKHAVVGIGLNVNQVDFSMLENRATSIANELGFVVDNKLVMSRLLECVERRYLQLMAAKVTILETDYYAAMLGFNTWNQFRILETNETIHAKITGIDTSGRLCLENPIQRYYFDLKEIEFLTFATE